MRYNRISADCHIDLPWLPPEVFTSNASAALKDRMPYVAGGPDGPHWTSKKGHSYGLVCGVGRVRSSYRDRTIASTRWPRSRVRMPETFMA